MRLRFLAWSVISLVMVGCSSSPEPKHEEAPAAEHKEQVVSLDAEQRKLAGIKTAPVTERLVQDSLEAPGTVNATTLGHAVVTPPVAGRVVSIQVALGASVKQGQTLAIIDSAELAQTWSSVAEAERLRDAAGAGVDEAASELRLAQAKLVSTERTLKTQRDLAKTGAFTQGALQQAKSELNDAQSELLSIQKEIATHGDSFRRLESLFRDGIVSRVDYDAAKLELQQDQIRQERAQNRVKSARTAFDREQAIASQGLMNSKELNGAEGEVRAARLEVQRATARLSAAKSAAQNAGQGVRNAKTVYTSSSAGAALGPGKVRLVAPISGKLTRLDLTKGQAVDRTQAVMEIEDLSSVWVTANVAERDAHEVRKGATATIRLAALPDREFKGFVQIIGDKVDPKTRAVPVQCWVKDPAGLLKPEMFANVLIGFGEGRRGPAVPQSAVVTEGENLSVFILDSKGFRKQPVVVGASSAGWVQVVSGLEAGDVVAIAGTFVLTSELKKDQLKGDED